jgi:hypothetical protein
MRKQIIILGIIIVFTLSLSGCTEEESSTVIEIEIESFYSFNVEGYITIDGIEIQNFSIGLFDTRNFVVNKSRLPEQQYHNVTIFVESEDQLINASCNQVTKSVKFSLSVNFKLSCLAFE